MNFMKWLDARVARMGWMDIALLKICVAAFTLMLAKLWPIILTPHWAIFAFIFLLAYAPLKQVQIGKLTESLATKQKRPEQTRPPIQQATPGAGFSAWMQARVDNLNALDIGLLKVSVTVLTLLLAKYWPPLLTPDWKIFGGIFLITYVPLMVKLFPRKNGHAGI